MKIEHKIVYDYLTSLYKTSPIILNEDLFVFEIKGEKVVIRKRYKNGYLVFYNNQLEKLDTYNPLIVVISTDSKVLGNFKWNNRNSVDDGCSQNLKKYVVVDKSNIVTLKFPRLVEIEFLCKKEGKNLTQFLEELVNDRLLFEKVEVLVLKEDWIKFKELAVQHKLSPEGLVNKIIKGFVKDEEETLAKSGR